MRTGHWKLVHPAGIKRGTARSIAGSRVYLSIDGEEFQMPGVVALTVVSRIDEPDKVIMEAIGTVEVVYSDEDEAETSAAMDAEALALVRSLHDTDEAQ